MHREILLNVEAKETRCAFLKEGILHDLIIERNSNRQLSGNIYRGRVTNILHNIQSAFIDIGEKENGFVHISDLLENRKKFQTLFDIDFDSDPSEKDIAEEDLDIAQILKIDQPVLVQAIKEPIGNKGTRLTSSISIPGRYLVLIPNSSHRGVSRKIEKEEERERLKSVLHELHLPKDVGVICRTASLNSSLELIEKEVEKLLLIWKGVIKKFNSSNKPTCLFEENDLVKKALFTAIDKRYQRILIDDRNTFQRCTSFHQDDKIDSSLKIELYRDRISMFERFGIEREIEKALSRKIWLPSGGYLFFDRTEAMCTIDINSGRSKDQQKMTNVEESLVHINMEAAEEIARQLRIRNIGGLIICDFIDMRMRKSQKRVLERLKESMHDDSAKCTILSMSEFGLIEMTRQRSRESLLQMMFVKCPYCKGYGSIKNHESVTIEIERSLKKLIHQQQFALQLVSHPSLDLFLSRSDKKYLTKLAEQLNAHLQFESNDSLHLNEFQFYSTTNGMLLEI